jgi:glycosyltransferase involved in cell wall biosynthesis
MLQSKQMNIVMGIPFLYPAIGYGGAARAAYQLAEALQELGHTVTVLTTDVWDSNSRYHENGFHPEFEVIRVPNLSNSVAYRLQFYTPLGILKHAQRTLSKADILHLHTFRNLLNDLLARSAVKQRIPYVLSGHGTIPRIERFIWIKRVYDLLMGTWQLKNAAGYIAVSDSERKSMRKFGLAGAKIGIIPNGIGDVPVVERGAFRREWKLDPDEKIILFLGKITPRKGLQYLVRAFSRMNNAARLVISGNDMGYAGNIRNLISRLRLEDRVLWTGLLDDRQKFEALQDADVTVYPSRHEVFGLVAVESICAGTPVIVCDDDGCGEIVRMSGGGDLVPWGDVGALCDSIQRRLKQGKMPEELMVAQERIRNRFNWHIIAKKTVKYYESCIEGIHMPVPAYETPVLE